MRLYSRLLFAAALCIVLPIIAFGQSDLCLPGVDLTAPAELRVEQTKIQAQQRVIQDMERRDWQVTMIPVKNSISNSTLRTLCIFRIEVISQTPGFVAIRAPKDTAMLDAIKEAIKGMDVPTPPPPAPAPARVVELTAYVLGSLSDVRAMPPGWMPIPPELQAVSKQLKALVPGELYLVDTVLVRGFERNRLSLSGGTTISAAVNIRDGNPPVVRLDALTVESKSNLASFSTNLDVPVGSQIVVGKTSSIADSQRSIIVVMSARIVN